MCEVNTIIESKSAQVKIFILEPVAESDRSGRIKATNSRAS